MKHIKNLLSSLLLTFIIVVFYGCNNNKSPVYWETYDRYIEIHSNCYWSLYINNEEPILGFGNSVIQISDSSRTCVRVFLRDTNNQQNWFITIELLPESIEETITQPFTYTNYICN